MYRRWLLAVVALIFGAPAFAQEKKELRWGTDPTGGAPYVYQDAQGNYVGFEYEFAAYAKNSAARASRSMPTGAPCRNYWKSRARERRGSISF